MGRIKYRINMLIRCRGKYTAKNAVFALLHAAKKERTAADIFFGGVKLRSDMGLKVVISGHKSAMTYVWI